MTIRSTHSMFDETIHKQTLLQYMALTLYDSGGCSLYRLFRRVHCSSNWCRIPVFRSPLAYTGTETWMR